ncbi:MAG: ABC transporter permease, partial [Alphaproteobacteria bacterium]|nr:ABC transporter permease [Alphaproteobacteria bacterium]
GFAAGSSGRVRVGGGVVALCVTPLVTIRVSAPYWTAFHGLMASTMLALLGIAGGVWSEKFDHIAAVTNFIVTPLSFLSGTFYTIDRLPDAWRMAAHFNPFFYMIDGFRYGFIGHTDTNPLLGAAVMLGVNAGLALLCWRMFARGYKLRA